MVSDVERYLKSNKSFNKDVANQSETKVVLKERGLGLMDTVDMIGLELENC